MQQLQPQVLRIARGFFLVLVCQLRSLHREPSGQDVGGYHHLDVGSDAPRQQVVVPGRHLGGEGQPFFRIVGSERMRDGLVPDVSLEQLNHRRVSFYPIRVQKPALVLRNPHLFEGFGMRGGFQRRTLLHLLEHFRFQYLQFHIFQFFAK